MKKKVEKFIYWAPRMMSILFACFLALMSLDVFSMEASFWEIALAFFMHNTPVYILAAIIIIAWKRELVGAVGFILAGFIYAGLVLNTMRETGFEWYYLAWVGQISGIAFFVGILFFLGWYRKSKKDNSI
ncbi:TPA: hypothetical protein HA265_00480 [Candidatus Woesearchaeota archaeon]|nr:hypothetical protein [Candidatus Woesearchaeota archaeon]